MPQHRLILVICTPSPVGLSVSVDFSPTACIFTARFFPMLFLWQALCLSPTRIISSGDSPGWRHTLSCPWYGGCRCRADWVHGLLALSCPPSLADLLADLFCLSEQLPHLVWEAGDVDAGLRKNSWASNYPLCGYICRCRLCPREVPLQVPGVVGFVGCGQLIRKKLSCEASLYSPLTASLWISWPIQRSKTWGSYNKIFPRFVMNCVISESGRGVAGFVVPATPPGGAEGSLLCGVVGDRLLVGLLFPLCVAPCRRHCGSARSCCFLYPVVQVLPPYLHSLHFFSIPRRSDFTMSPFLPKSRSCSSWPPPPNVKVEDDRRIGKGREAVDGEESPLLGKSVQGLGLAVTRSPAKS